MWFTNIYYNDNHSQNKAERIFFRNFAVVIVRNYDENRYHGTFSIQMN